MERRLISDAGGRFVLDLEVTDVVLADALEHRRAEDVLKCAAIAALVALVEGEERTDQFLAELAQFMREVQRALARGTMH